MSMKLFVVAPPVSIKFVSKQFVSRIANSILKDLNRIPSNTSQNTGDGAHLTTSRTTNACKPDLNILKIYLHFSGTNITVNCNTMKHNTISNINI